MDLERDAQRLIPTHPDLSEPLADFYRRNREAFQYIDPVRAGDFFTPEHQRAALERELRDWQEGQSRRFYLERTEAPGRIVGLIGLNNIIWGAFRSAFLGYKLDAQCWGRGWMTQAVGLVTRFAFQELGLHRIEGNVMPRNKASIRVLEKNGYRPEGMARSYLEINGVWEDHIHMVKLAEDQDENEEGD